MGGMIAQTMAARHPDRVLSLASIMSNTGHRWKGMPGLRVYPVSPSAGRRATARPRSSGGRGVQADRLARLPVRRGRSCAAAELQLRPRLQPAGRARQLAAIIAAGDRTGSCAITAPTVVIHGTKDRMVPPVGRPRDRGRDPGRPARGDRGHGPRPARAAPGTGSSKNPTAGRRGGGRDSGAGAATGGGGGEAYHPGRGRGGRTRSPSSAPPRTTVEYWAPVRQPGLDPEPRRPRLSRVRRDDARACAAGPRARSDLAACWAAEARPARLRGLKTKRLGHGPWAPAAEDTYRRRRRHPRAGGGARADARRTDRVVVSSATGIARHQTGHNSGVAHAGRLRRRARRRGAASGGVRGGSTATRAGRHANEPLRKLIVAARRGRSCRADGRAR